MDKQVKKLVVKIITKIIMTKEIIILILIIIRNNSFGYMRVEGKNTDIEHTLFSFFIWSSKNNSQAGKIILDTKNNKYKKK
jgi:hypothetical protein